MHQLTLQTYGMWQSTVYKYNNNLYLLTEQKFWAKLDFLSKLNPLSDKHDCGRFTF